LLIGNNNNYNNNNNNNIYNNIHNNIYNYLRMSSPVRSLSTCPFTNRVAVGREQGDIEIREAKYKWHSIANAPGCIDFQLQSITWSKIYEERGRLFGISLRGFIFELDMSTLIIKNVRDTYGGAAWCMTSSVRDATIAVGAEDGAAHLFDYSNNRLEYIRGLPNTGSRVLSIAYHPVKPQLFLGLADGTIRCIDEKNGASFFRMTGDIFRGLSTHIWSMIVLTDSTVVTGDGRGNVQIWDGTVGVLILNIHQNTAEILALAVTPDERQIFASGVDGRVTCIKKVFSNDKTISDDMGAISNANLNPSDSQWVYTSSHRPHSHDVYALTICMNTTNNNINSSSSRVRSNSDSDNNSNNDSDNSTRKRSGSFSLQTNPNPNTQRPLDIDGYVLLSGGMDTKLCCYSVSDFVRIRPTWILPMPATGIVHYSLPEYETIAVKHRNRIDLWDTKLLFDNESNNIENINDIDNCKVFLRIETSTPDHIHSFSLAPNGKFIAFSSVAGTRVWRLDRSENGHAKITKLILADHSLSFCHCMCFSPDSNRLAAYTSKGLLLLLDLSSCNLSNTNSKKKSKKNNNENDDDENVNTVKVWHVFNHKHELVEKNKRLKTADSEDIRLRPGLGLQEVGLSVVFSPDNLYVALSDATGGISVYEIDRLRLHWHVPNPSPIPCPVTALSFHPTSPTCLVVTLANNTFMIFDVEQLNLTQWSIDNSDKVANLLRYTFIFFFIIFFIIIFIIIILIGKIFMEHWKV